jgi:hypothetical protein
LSWIKKLEQDLKDLTNHPNLDSDPNLRTSEAFLANELAHLEKVKARTKKTTLHAQLTAHGEKLGGIWFAINKEKIPHNLIR